MKLKFIVLLVLYSLSNSIFAYQVGKIPSSLQELISSSDLIVVGHLGKISTKGIFYGYQENANTLAELDKLTPIPLGMPYIDYEINIESLIMSNDGKDVTISLEQPIIYRVFQPQIESEYKFGNAQEKVSLFFLSKTSNGNIYGTKTPVHHLTLNGQKSVSYFFYGKEFIPHTLEEAYQLSSDNFLNKVIMNVSKRSLSD